MTFTEWAQHRLRSVIHNETIFETDDDADTISTQDLAPLLYTRTLLTGVLPAEKIHYLVVDEAQDLSPSELLVLKAFTDEGHMLIVGDIMQGIINPNGVKSWENIIGEILTRDKTKLFNILTSYRTTKSIVEYVNKHLRKAGISANLFPRPVLRQGTPPTIHTKLEPDDMISKITSIIRTEQTEDRNNIAIIVPGKHLEFFYNEISQHIDDVVKIEHDDSEYPGGVMLSHISLFKGLEFDTVIFVNLPEDRSPDLQLKQFYTACTRAMHRLFIFDC